MVLSSADGTHQSSVLVNSDMGLPPSDAAADRPASAGPGVLRDAPPDHASAVLVPRLLTDGVRGCPL